MKVTVNQDVCIGSGNCEGIAPAIFKLEDGVSHVKIGTVPEDQEDKVKQA